MIPYVQKSVQRGTCWLELSGNVTLLSEDGIVWGNNSGQSGKEVAVES